MKLYLLLILKVKAVSVCTVCIRVFYKNKKRHLLVVH